MEISWHGHAFFELEAATGTNILIDPFLEDNPSTERTPADFTPNLVAVTHGDYFDHAGEATEFDAEVLCQSLMARDLEKDGSVAVTDLNLGGSTSSTASGSR